MVGGGSRGGGGKKLKLGEGKIGEEVGEHEDEYKDGEVGEHVDGKRSGEGEVLEEENKEEVFEKRAAGRNGSRGLSIVC